MADLIDSNDFNAELQTLDPEALQALLSNPAIAGACNLKWQKKILNLNFDFFYCLLLK